MSAGTISFEILLVRIFAIEHFHHFAYMAIGVAMLGFGMSGTLLALIGKPNAPSAQRWFLWSTIGTAVLLFLSPTFVHLISLDPTQLAWDYRQWIALLLVYVLLALPFAAGAMCVLLCLGLESERPGFTYGVSFLGSGIGALLPLALLSLFPPHHALAVPALVAATGAAVFVLLSQSERREIAAAGIVFLLAAVTSVKPAWSLNVSQYKALAQVEAHPEAQRLAEAPSSIGWVVAVDAPTYRFAPGLSLGYTGRFPRQTALFVDGSIVGATESEPRGDSTDSVFVWLPTALPYQLSCPEKVLVIGAGGSSEAAAAGSFCDTRVTAVELHPWLAKHADSVYADVSDVEWVVADARSVVARSTERFDLVSIAPAGGLASSAAGMLSLSEDFLHTVEAYESYLKILSDNGMLAVTRWLSVPPRESVRVILTLVEAMRRLAPDHVEDGLAALRSWGTATVIAKPAGFSPADLDSLISVASLRQFDIDWIGHRPITASRFHHIEQPTLTNAAAAAIAGADSLLDFTRDYPFDVTPARDARPYPHRFVRTQSIGRLLGNDRGAWLPFAEWGPIALVATVVQSVIVALLFLLLPAAVAARRSGQTEKKNLGYFLAIGFAFMATEIAMIQQLSLLLGHPIFAVVVVLSGFLVCSGFGSIWSDRLAPERGWIIGAGLLLILMVYAALLLDFVHLFQRSPLMVRVVFSAVIVCPVAALMGTPFPLGLRGLAGESKGGVAWAWAANGFASVVAAPVAALIALDRGTPELLLLAAVAYGTAGIMIKGGVELNEKHRTSNIEHRTVG